MVIVVYHHQPSIEFLCNKTVQNPLCDRIVIVYTIGGAETRLSMDHLILDLFTGQAEKPDISW